MLGGLSEQSENSRMGILQKYCKQNNILPTSGVRVCRPGTELTVVVPAYQEEKNISKTLLSIGATSESIEIVVVDNGSTDKTKEIITDTARLIRWPVIVLDCARRGPVFARKRGIDEVVVQYLATGPSFLKPRYVAMTDGDTEVGENWVRVILDTFKNTAAQALGGVHEYPLWVDQEIERVVGIPDFLGGLSQAAYYLTERGCALVQTNGANFAIEISAYAAIGGSRQPTDEKGTLIKGSDRLFGHALRARGGQVSFIPVMTVTNPRSILFSLSEDKNPAYFRDMEKWVDCREDEITLLHKAIETLQEQDWIQNKRAREISFVHHNIVQPVIEGQLSFAPLAKLMGSDHVCIQELRDIRSREDFKYDQPLNYLTWKIAERHTQSVLDAVRSNVEHQVYHVVS